jgi:putative ABC transport system substrate-binding protein
VRPGGNVTGMSLQLSDTAGKRLELLREVVPSLRRLAIITNVGNPTAALEVSAVQAAAGVLDVEIATTSEIRRQKISRPPLTRSRATPTHFMSAPTR